MKVSELQAPAELVAAWKNDLEDLTPIQEAVLQAGILEGRENLLVCKPEYWRGYQAWPIGRRD